MRGRGLHQIAAWRNKNVVPDAHFYRSEWYRHWRRTGKRPTAREMERLFAASGRDYLQTAQALHRQFGDGVPITYWNEEVRLPLGALVDVPEALQDYDVLVRCFPLMTSAYGRSKDEPRLTSKDLQTAGWTAEDTTTVDRLLSIEPGLTGGGSTHGPDSWSYVLDPSVAKLQDRNGEAYIRRRLKENKRWDRRGRRAFGRMRRPGAVFSSNPWGKFLLAIAATVLGGLLLAAISRWLGWL